MSELPDIPEVVEDAISDLISAVCDREHGLLRRAAIDQGNVEKARDALARLFAEALQTTKPDAVAGEFERGLEIGGEIGRCYDGPEGEDARKKMAARFRALTEERDEWRAEAERLTAQITARSQP